jgi:hypothetical protein
MCETASRIPFLKAGILAKGAEMRPLLGQIFAGQRSPSPDGSNFRLHSL